MPARKGTAFCAPFFLLLSVLGGCVADAPYKTAGPTAPVPLNDGWEVAAPADVGISAQVLARIHTDFVSEDRFFNARSLLIIKEGKLVFEAYCHGSEDRDLYRNVQSVTKVVTSLVFGQTLAGGYFDSLNQTLYSLMPEAFPADERKRAITLRHLLTMTSGLSFDNDVFSVEIYSDQPADPARYILAKPLYALPGAKFYYRDCDPHLLSYAIRRRTGETEARWAAERLFEPLGIEAYYWDSDHTGATMGAHGLYLKPRDLAKIGQLVLDHGRWKGNQIVDSAWIAISTQTQVHTDYNAPPNVRDYGYYWWILPDWQAVEAWGHGGSYLLIVPGRNLVIVMTSSPYPDDDVVGTRPEAFHQLVAPLVD